MMWPAHLLTKLLAVAVLQKCSSDNGIIIAGAPAFYPRTGMISTSSGTAALAVMERPTSALPHRLALLRRTSLSPTEEWAEVATVHSDTRDGVDLANGYLWQMADGTLLCAYRYHTGTNTPTPVYRISLSSSHDEGTTWSPLANVTVSGVGVWEPMLFSTRSDSAGTVRVLYSAELTNGGEQDIVGCTSTDGGASWSAINTRVHTDLSRNGMPGVVQAADGSLVMVFEGFWTGQWGHFTVNSARSFDDGKTWVQRQIVHAPGVSDMCNGVACCAGSPQVGLCPESNASQLSVVFMSNENHPGRAPLASPVPWPSGAGVGTVSALVPSNGAPINWTQAGQAAFAPLVSDAALWPSVLLDTQAADLRLAYQTEDGAAALSAYSLCPL